MSDTTEQSGGEGTTTSKSDFESFNFAELRDRTSGIF